MRERVAVIDADMRGREGIHEVDRTSAAFQPDQHLIAVNDQRPAITTSLMESSRGKIVPSLRLPSSPTGPAPTIFDLPVFR